MKLSKYSHLWMATLLVVGGLTLGGCTKERALALKQAASVFRNESIAAIDNIETMLRKEVEPVPRTQAEMEQSFVIWVLDRKIPDQDIAENLDLILQGEPTISIGGEQELKNFTANLRQQYNTLASIYDRAERGHLVAAEAIQKSKEPLHKLTAQMAYFALCSETYPVRLLQYRADIASKLVDLRHEYQNTQNAPDAEAQQEIVKMRIAEQMRRLQATQRQEKELTRSAVEQATKAAIIGTELSEQLDRYDRISLEDISTMIPRVMNLVSSLSGRDYSSLRIKATEVVDTIRADEDWYATVDWVLTQMPTADDTAHPSLPTQCYAPSVQSAKDQPVKEFHPRLKGVSHYVEYKQRKEEQ